MIYFEAKHWWCTGNWQAAPGAVPCVFRYEIWPGHQPALPLHCALLAALLHCCTLLRRDWGALAHNISTLRKPSKLSPGGQEFNGPNLIVNESRVSTLTDTIMGMKSMMPGSEIIMEKTVGNLLNMLILLILWSWSNYSSSIMIMDSKWAQYLQVSTQYLASIYKGNTKGTHYTVST